MKISIVCDNKDSWIIPYAKKLNQKLNKMNHKSSLMYNYEDIRSGDLAFFLSCEKIVSEKKLLLNKKNLVVHESSLPKGKGWSPVTWQILEGFNSIPITLFEANSEVDSGDIYLQDFIELQGHELISEIKHLQGKHTIDLILKFIDLYPNVYGKKQIGHSTYYPKRSDIDSELDINKSILEQFNLLRVVDNRRYPAYFIINGFKYKIAIEKEKNNEVKY